MGRYVYCNGKCVWKYSFAEQSSDQYRITEELSIGKVVYPNANDLGNFYGDTLILHRSDISLLENALGPHQKELKNWKEFNNAAFPAGMVHIGSKRALIRQENLSRNPDLLFWEMVEAYVKFMKKHPHVDEFRFEGDY